MTIPLNAPPSLASDSDATVTGTKSKRDPEEVFIDIADQMIGGWEEVEITLRLEGFPNSFSIAASTSNPVGGANPTCREGSVCTIMIGNDQVIAGYVDRSTESGADSVHTIALQGRGRTQDLVDCSAELPTGQLVGGNTLSIAQKLVQPYEALAVEMGPGADPGPDVPAWALNYGETGAEIIQKFARNAGLLAYEDSHGRLILGKVGDKKAASGVKYGVNAQAWSCENSMDGRYSDIVIQGLPQDSIIDVSGPGYSVFKPATDKGVPRHRLVYHIVEQVGGDANAFAQSKAYWDAARRAGRAHIVHATIDSWRDKDGTLWAPNTLVPVDLPGNRAGKELVIAEVTFRRSNESGTTADLTLMTKEALMPEPLVLNSAAIADVTGPDGQ